MRSQREVRLYDILRTALGEGIAGHLLNPQITEIRVNSNGQVWTCHQVAGKQFTGEVLPEEARIRVISAVAYGVDEECNNERPLLAAELPGTGERFQGVLPPITTSPVFVIRKKAIRVFTLDDLVSQMVLTPERADTLRESVRGRKNILVVGGTDSGKTTFANALLDVLKNANERILILEDTRELQCEAADVEYLRTKDGTAGLRELVRTSLRMSPDRIVVGEVRGPEGLELTKAWNTGHSGGISTIHANSAGQGLVRLEQLIQESGITPSRALIADAINVVVFMEKAGTRRIVRTVARVLGATGSSYDLEPVKEGKE